jgi:hypothetical protein
LQTEGAPIVLSGAVHTAAARPAENRFARAGCPRNIAPWARVSYGPKYTAYNVGGAKTPGILFAGPPLARDEGTFGVDYNPWYSRVVLRRSHGFLYQGGLGQYEPDHKNWPILVPYRLR